MFEVAFEIWQERDSGERYLVGCRSGAAYVVVGPLSPTEDPRRALEQRSARRYTGAAIADMHRHPERYRREYATDQDGRAVLVEDPEDTGG